MVDRTSLQAYAYDCPQDRPELEKAMGGPWSADWAARRETERGSRSAVGIA